MSNSFNSHLALSHRLQQSRLSLRSGAVDFICEHDVREDWAGFPFENSRMLVVNRQTNYVRGKQVRSKLYSLESTVQRTRQRMSQTGLANSGNVFNQQVAAGKQRHDRKANRFRLSLDYG